MPLDKLSKSLHEIGNEAQRIGALSSVAQNGQQAIANMYELLKQVYGENVNKVFNPTGKNSLEMMNEGVDANIDNKRKAFESHKTAVEELDTRYNATKSDYKDYKNQLSDQKKKVAELDGLSDEVLDKIKNNEEILSDELSKHDGETLRILKKYNEILKQVKAAKKDLRQLKKDKDDESVQLFDSAAEYANAEALEIDNKLSNTQAYYKKFQDYYQASLGKNQAMISNLSNYGSFTKNSSAIEGYLGTNIGVLNN